ncbi:MAG: hypothetical protein EA360_06835 [Balneolaceae bacterium]|nr:MAG: hypothetical protein EA360_06835 [Balneolaceae bacterium]
MNHENNIARLAGILKKNPDDSFAKFALALELLKRDDVSKARLLFESIRQQDPGYLGVYYHLGKLYEKTSLHERAVETYREGIELAAKTGEQKTLLELNEALLQLIPEQDHE